MKKLILSASVAFSVLATTNVSAQQGFGTNAPDKSSAVDIFSSKRGLLIPRLELKSTGEASPVTKPAESLLVYNTTTTGDVTPGFYYWEQNRWVRFVASNTEKTVTVTAGTNVNVDVDSSVLNTTDYKVSVKPGDEDGKVLVTKIDGGNSTTVWVDPKKFVFNAVSATNGLTIVNDKEGNSQFELGGALTKDLTTIGTGNGKNLAIIGLTDVSKDFKVDEQKIVVMGEDGILKITSPKSLIEESIAKGNLVAKTLTTDGKIVVGEADSDVNSLSNSVLVDTKLSIKKGSITTTEIAKDAVTTEKIIGGAVTAEKLGAKTEDQGKVPVVQADGTVVYKNIFEEGVNAKTLKGAGITVTAGDAEGIGSSVASSLLKDVTLGIADNAITSEKIADGEVKTSDLAGGAVTTEKISGGAVTADKMTAGTTNADGTVTKADKGSVPIAGEDGKVTYQNVSTTLGEKLTTDGKIVIGDDKKSEWPNSVLVETKLSIKEGSITTTEIADGTIQAVDIATADPTSVLVTGTDGVVKWEKQSALNNKDTFKGGGPIAVNAGTDNTTGGKEYTISIANANGNSTAGVVNEAENDPTINFVNGVATVNVENISKTQGKGLTSTSITVKDGANALLHAASIEITPGATDGMVLVTTGTDTKTTKWVPAGELGNTVTANNGLTMDKDNNITLGGDIDSPTTLNVTADKGSLSIKGLKPATGANKVVVVNGEGVLATVNQSMSPTVISSTTNISKIDGYSPLTPEVVIEVQIGPTDIDLELPAPSGAEGQTISVKIVNTVEPSAYLNIKANGTELTYGAMPFQGWIIKSNGSKWIIVGRN